VTRPSLMRALPNPSRMVVRHRHGQVDQRAGGNRLILARRNWRTRICISAGISS
jgi:hypothetical protein